MQAPAAVVITVEPETVHTGGVSEVNATGSPEDAAADNVTGSPGLAWDGGSKAMVCDLCPGGFTARLARLTWNDCVTLWAGA